MREKQNLLFLQMYKRKLLRLQDFLNLKGFGDAVKSINDDELDQPSIHGGSQDYSYQAS